MFKEEKRQIHKWKAKSFE